LDNIQVLHTGNAYGQAIEIADLQVQKCMVSNVYIFDVPEMGLQVSGSVGTIYPSMLTLDNVHVSNSLDAGISIESMINNATLTNCSVIGQKGYSPNSDAGGLDLIGCTGVTVIGGVFAGRYGVGICIYNSSNIIVNGSQILNNGNEASATGTDPEREVGVIIRAEAANCQNNTITNCLIEDTQATATNAITAQANSGQANVTVTTPNLFFPGQQVQIADSTPQSEYGIVQSINGSVVTLVSNLTHTYTLAKSPTLQGKGSQLYGVNEWNYLGTVSNTKILNNVFQGNKTLAINLVSTTDVVKNNTGFNPIGKITNPIGTGTIGLVGSGTTVTSATVYTVSGVDCFITSTGGTVSNIVIKDAGGNTMLTGVTTLTNQFVPIGYSVTWTHTGAPTVTVFGN
jgi:hypothetical protein